MADYPLFADVVNKQLVRGFTSNIPKNLISVVQGDTLNIPIRFMAPTGDANNPFTDIDYSGAGIKIAIGTPNAYPTSGTFVLTFGASTTTALSYASTAAQIQTALNLLASIAALTPAGVVVSGPDGGPWTITFNAVGAQADITGDGTLLYPTAGVITSTVRTGTGALKAIQRILLYRNPAAYQNTFTAFPSANIIITTLQDGAAGINEAQMVNPFPVPYSGTFNLTVGAATTNPIPYNASASDMVAALASLSSVGAGNVAVSGAAGGPWVVTFIGALAGTNVGQMTFDASGLIVPIGRTGTLDLNTSGIDDIIYAALPTLYANSYFEIQITPSGGKPITIGPIPIIVLNDLIDDSASVPTPKSSYFTTTEVLDLIRGAPSPTTEFWAVSLANGAGSSVVVVPFASGKSGAWHCTGGPNIINVTDANPLVLFAGTIKARNANGFTFLTNGETDSGNYIAEGEVSIN